MPAKCGVGWWPESRVRWLLLLVAMALVGQAISLTGPNVCLVKQKYNITKRIKYRAPMAIRQYVWCLAVPPRCSRWTTEIRDLTRLETEERTAEVAVCCVGYKIKDISCVPVCPHGKTGPKCTLVCPNMKWGPNCVHDCKRCLNQGTCSPVTGECRCDHGWQGERCETSMTTTTVPTTTKQTLLTSTKPSGGLTTVLVETTLKSSSDDTSSGQSTTEHSTQNVTVSQKTTIQTNANIEHNDWQEIITKIPHISNSFNHSISTTYSPKDLDEESKFNLSSERSIQPTTESSKVENKRNTTTGGSIQQTTELIYIENNVTTKINDITSTTLNVANGKMTLTEPAATINLTTETIPTTTNKPTVTSVRTKPKEIWIKPAQKGESPLIETKNKPSFEVPHVRHRNATQKEYLTGTTPRTIIVSIIPTSLSHAAFKKISLTTAMTHHLREFTPRSRSHIRSDSTSSSAAPFTIRILNTSKKRYSPSTELLLTSPSILITHTAPSTTEQSVFPAINFNSMTSTSEANILSLDTSSTTTPSITTSTTEDKSTTVKSPLVTKVLIKESYKGSDQTTPEKDFKLVVKRNKAPPNIDIERAPLTESNEGTTNPITSNIIQSNVDDNDVTEEPKEESYLLTEPEHITAVFGDSAPSRPSLDLVSVVVLAVGIMVIVITTAVIIVMMDRCRKTRYDDLMRRNNVPMKIVIDNDMPPPYVRSIFHTPLPDPPTTEKCHYQPISTLDRNLKQFMRPVVVQNVSPLMIENFRGILECHYDHLPQRNGEFRVIHDSASTAPSVRSSCEPLSSRVSSVDEDTIEALKADTKLDEHDTTSEPLYAEIPWRPPSEYANETITLNGEAVTEL